MKEEKIKKYIQSYLDDVITPKVNSELVGEEDEPIEIKVSEVMVSDKSPNRISIFLEMYPNWSSGSIGNMVNQDLSRFIKMLNIDRNLHIYWNKNR
jgi:hypothetical protein